MLKPARDLVLIRPGERASMKGHIHIPESAQDASMAGTVVAVGHDCTVYETRYDLARQEDRPFTPFVKMLARTGMKVAYTRAGAMPCELEGEKYVIISVRGIHGEIREGTDGTKEFAPFYDRLLVTVDAPEGTSAGGIIIPNKARRRASSGTVIAFGKVMLNGEPADNEFTKGSRIMFSQSAGIRLTLDGHEHLMLDRDQVLGVFGD
ncbi:MAG: hypothetical protein JRI80_00255 [Deltaproteobacteria bacterium]|nr:hypothetical protein [Deltaproteobacteria bacterium]